VPWRATQLLGGRDDPVGSLLLRRHEDSAEGIYSIDLALLERPCLLYRKTAVMLRVKTEVLRLVKDMYECN
jgi:hypothetical protein